MAELFGHEVGDLPEGWLATGVLVLVKCYAPDAPEDDLPIRISIRGSDNLSTIDALGMVYAGRLDIEEQYKESMGDG
jgi:hypothetical protein